MPRRRRLSPTTIIAVLALVFAIGGTAVAASRYVITSKSQIKPSVLRELRASPSAAEAKLSAKGVHAVVTKARSVGSVEAMTRPAEAEDPLTGGTWIQHPEEDELFVGEITVTRPTRSGCAGGEQALVAVLLDGEGVGYIDPSPVPDQVGVLTETEDIRWEVKTYGPGLFEPTTSTGHTLAVRAWDECTKEHVQVDSVGVDVLGFH